MSAERRINYCRICVIFFIALFVERFEFVCSKASNSSYVINNLAVTVFEDTNYVKNSEGHGPLKLNITWKVSLSSRKPSSYSILITSLNKHEAAIDNLLCPDETLFYTTRDGDRCQAVLPENIFLSEAPELSIRPTCIYGIQVFANPRNNPKLKVPEIIVTVPECVGRWCSCEKAQEYLPVPEVDIRSQSTEDIEIGWNSRSSDPRVHSYVISFGVPILISNNRLPVYNISKIANVPSTVSSYSWPLNSTDLDVTTRGKVYVAAENSVGCVGKPGTVLMNYPIEALASVQRTDRWLVWVSLIGMLIMIGGGAVSFLYIRSRNKYELTWGNHATSRIQSLVGLTSLRSQWARSTLRERNVLYVEQEIQDKADEFEISYERLKFIRELGKGQFGNVYLGKIEDHCESIVAIKMSNCTEPSTEPQARQQLLAEIETMKIAGSHPHLVRLLATCTLPDKPICVILEYLEGGDLLAHLHRLRDSISHSYPIYDSGVIESSRIQRPSLTETVYTTLDDQSSITKAFPKYPTNNSSTGSANENEEKYVNVTEDDSTDFSDACNDLDVYQFTSFALDIARGMEHLETRGIIHRDLAARNILLTKYMKLKISDFGLSRNDSVYVIGNGGGCVRRLPVRWMAPEALRDRAFTSKSDVWSFAVVLWEIGTLGAFPYSDIQDHQLLRHVLRDVGRLDKPENVTPELYDIMQYCWSSRPENRPSFRQLVQRLSALGEPSHFFRATSNPCYSLLPTVMPMINESINR